MKTILRIVLLCLYMVGPIQAGQALWAYAWLGSKTITEDGVRVGTLSDYYIFDNENGDGPYLSYRIKVTTVSSQEIFPEIVVTSSNPNEPPDYFSGEEGIGVGDLPPGDEYSGNPGIQFNLNGTLDDYSGAIFTMEVGLASFEDAGDDNWYMSDFSLIGYAIATTDELSDGTYTFFDLGPTNIKAWCPDIIVDSPVPEPSTTFLVILGLCAILTNRRNQSF